MGQTQYDWQDFDEYEDEGEDELFGLTVLFEGWEDEQDEDDTQEMPAITTF